jgi:hypothetical protein
MEIMSYMFRGKCYITGVHSAWIILLHQFEQKYMGADYGHIQSRVSLVAVSFHGAFHIDED